MIRKSAQIHSVVRLLIPFTAILLSFGCGDGEAVGEDKVSSEDLDFSRKILHPETGDSILVFRYHSGVSCEAEIERGVENGMITCNYGDGRRYLVGSYADGLKEGHWAYYYPQGQIRLRECYHKDLLIGDRTFYGSEGNVTRYEFVLPSQGAAFYINYTEGIPVEIEGEVPLFTIAKPDDVRAGDSLRIYCLVAEPPMGCSIEMIKNYLWHIGELRAEKTILNPIDEIIPGQGGYMATFSLGDPGEYQIGYQFVLIDSSQIPISRDTSLFVRAINVVE